VAITLAEHGLPHQTRLVDLQDKPEDFTSVYRDACADPEARAKVPILEGISSDGTPFVLTESLVICDFIEEAEAAKPRTPTQRASARLFSTLFPQWLSYVPILKAEPGSVEEAKAVDALRAGLRAADAFLRKQDEQQLAAAGPFLLGNDFSLAETATAPFALRFVKVLPGLRPALQPEAIMAEEGLSRLSAWMGAVGARASCTNSLPPDDTLVESYARLLERMRATPA